MHKRALRALLGDYESTFECLLTKKHKILLDDYKVRPELNKHKNIREYLIIDFFITPNDR